jgi:hypothetical protein
LISNVVQLPGRHALTLVEHISNGSLNTWRLEPATVGIVHQQELLAIGETL